MIPFDELSQEGCVFEYDGDWNIDNPGISSCSPGALYMTTSIKEQQVTHYGRWFTVVLQVLNLNTGLAEEIRLAFSAVDQHPPWEVCGAKKVTAHDLI